jgi:putative membrane protein
MTMSLRNLRLVVMGSWSIFLLWLWQSDNVLRYLGTHTVWVVSFGAIALSVATVSYWWFSRGSSDASAAVSRGRLAGTLTLLIPIFVAVTMSNASLGALAASNKLAARGVDMAALARQLASNSDVVSFLQIAGAGKDPSLSDQLGLRNGSEVSLIGLVTKGSSTANGEFEFGRFYISCCVADAVPVTIPVKPGVAGGGPYAENDWVKVTGSLSKGDDGYTIDAQTIEPVSEPQHPYMSFS